MPRQTTFGVLIVESDASLARTQDDGPMVFASRTRTPRAEDLAGETAQRLSDTALAAATASGSIVRAPDVVTLRVGQAVDGYRGRCVGRDR